MSETQSTKLPAQADAEAAGLWAGPGAAGLFETVLDRHGLAPLVRGRVTTVQVNLGARCNQICRHCHVNAGPGRGEVLSRAVAERLVQVLAASPGVQVVDMTGGAPELNPSFRWIVAETRRLGLRVIDRCNLTVLFEPGMEDLAAFLAGHDVEVVASLPCYGAENVDGQRGPGVFAKSVEALGRLNGLGYGRPGSLRKLDLIYNPGGAFLPGAQTKLEAAYKEELGRRYGIEFHRLLTITNMPIQRFARMLEQEGEMEAYSSLLIESFNPSTARGLMCRSLVSVGWQGDLFDCDFHQVCGIALGAARDTGARAIEALESFEGLAGRPIATAGYCFGCTAGAGSSCQGALQ